MPDNHRRYLNISKILMQSRFSCFHNPAKGCMNEPLSVLCFIFVYSIHGSISQHSAIGLAIALNSRPTSRRRPWCSRHGLLLCSKLSCHCSHSRNRPSRRSRPSHRSRRSHSRRIHSCF